MRWWARLATENDYYGHWVPTPETDLEEAKFYIKHIRRPEGVVVEWLQM